MFGGPSGDVRDSELAGAMSNAKTSTGAALRASASVQSAEGLPISPSIQCWTDRHNAQAITFFCGGVFSSHTTNNYPQTFCRIGMQK
jgi:hypothetical protein